MKEISEKEMISMANSEIVNMDGYIKGMLVISAQQEGERVVIRGEIFTDEVGLPTEKTKLSFLIYSKISDKYSKEFTIV
ncbi:DUF2498 family protein [Klebsiella pneumoniae]|nr:DUF2498 family protein [Klebsiella pneumoniae]EKY4130407.1 DUF2498 family protein [Klebsiella quasipneumoniae]EKU2235399.1 DUF2498 family protein [Klebsiella pneumoniae]EKV3267889.1 DUF2498 family protein [Klebsiella pneumoniae]EMB9110324.1 DUF2498 family protein [Klebsiella quasipneumoniae]